MPIIVFPINLLNKTVMLSFLMSLQLSSCNNFSDNINEKNNITTTTVSTEKANTKEHVTEKPKIADTVNHATFTHIIQYDKKDHPFTENNNLIKIKANNIDIQELNIFLRYTNVIRLDSLASKLYNWENDSLPIIKFPKNKISTITNKEIKLEELQYLVGSIQNANNNISIFAIIDYKEAWGFSIKLISLNKDNEIIDAYAYYNSFGDGGGFINTEVYYKNDSTYTRLDKDGYQSFSEPIDTISYKIDLGTFYIKNNGTFEYIKNVSDSSLIETFKYNS